MRRCPYFLSRGILGAIIAAAPGLSGQESTNMAQQLDELRTQNRALQEQLQQQQRMIDRLTQQFSNLQQTNQQQQNDYRELKASVEENETPKKSALSLGNVIISGEGGVGIFSSQSNGQNPNTDLRVDEARLFIEAPVMDDIYFYSEVDLQTTRGGMIHVESTVGKGTTFVIELPVTQGAEVAAQPVAALKAAEPELHGKGKKILAVDDEEDIVDQVRKTLERRGYTVRTALNGESALRHLAHDEFDLIISDWKMPGINGQQLYERLRQIQPGAAERMIFMTGDVLSEKTERYLQEQNKICLAKPFSLEDFERAIQQTFEAA